MSDWELTDGQEAYGYLEKGWQAEADGSYEDAIRYYQGSLSIQKTPHAHRCLATVYSTLGDFEAANKECWQAIQLDPDCGDPYITLGTNLIELGKLDQAQRILNKAIGCSRTSHPGLAQETLGRLHEMKGDLMEAMGWYTHALEHQPDLVCSSTHLKRLRYYMN